MDTTTGRAELAPDSATSWWHLTATGAYWHCSQQVGGRLVRRESSREEYVTDTGDLCGGYEGCEICRL